MVLFLHSLMMYSAQDLKIMISVLITLTFLMHCLDLGGIPLAGHEISGDQILGL